MNILISVIALLGQIAIMVTQSRFIIKWQVINYIFQICGTTCLVIDQSATTNIFMALQMFVSMTFIIFTEYKSNYKKVLICFHGAFGCTQIIMNFFRTNFELNPWVVVSFLMFIAVKTYLVHHNF